MGVAVAVAGPRVDVGVLDFGKEMLELGGHVEGSLDDEMMKPRWLT
jgi:hypothetical protein